MGTVVAVWPNNTISIIRVSPGFTMLDLFSQLDVEASPLDATCYLVGTDEDGMHITFDWKGIDDGTRVTAKSPDVGISKLFGKIKKLPWPDDILKQWIRQLSFDARRQQALDSSRFLQADEIPQFPAVPSATSTVSEVRMMERFCGVYFAFNEHGTCHYVGELEDVPRRVSKSRPEIGNRTIGFVRCMPHDRKRIEAYFVAVLDPPGNGASSHRMRQKEATDGTHAG